MTYTASQNPKTGTTHTAAILFAALIFLAGIAALTMHPTEALAKPLCGGNGPCYANINVNATAADSANSLCDGMACMRSAIEGKLCAKRCLSGNGAAFIDENGNGICDNYENGLCPGKGLGYEDGNGLGKSADAQTDDNYGYRNGDSYGACANGGGCTRAYGHGHGACSSLDNGCQRAQNCPNR